MKPMTPKEAITQMAMYYNLSYIVEKRLCLAFQQMCDVTGKQLLQQMNTDDIVKIYRHWRSISRSAENMRKRIGYLRRVFKYAAAMGYIKRNPADLFRAPTMSMSDTTKLSPDEIARLRAAQLPLPVLEQVRDLFLLQCYTGLAYCDLLTFTAQNVYVVDAKHFIMGRRAKTGAEYILPLLPEAKEMLDTYRYRLPVYSNAYYNRLLKIVQRCSSIQTNLTTHLGRRTFGQMMLDKGVPLETVARMLGHKSVKTTERHYARTGLTRIMKDVGMMAA